MEANQSPEENKKSNLIGIVMITFFTLLMILIGSICLSGCTYSITMVHTEGQAQDVVDETATNTPSTSVSVPVSVVPKPAL